MIVRDIKNKYWRKVYNGIQVQKDYRGFLLTYTQWHWPICQYRHLLKGKVLIVYFSWEYGLEILTYGCIWKVEDSLRFKVENDCNLWGVDIIDWQVDKEQGFGAIIDS